VHSVIRMLNPFAFRVLFRHYKLKTSCFHTVDQMKVNVAVNNEAVDMQMYDIQTVQDSKVLLKLRLTWSF